jgi:hypothetical protein
MPKASEVNEINLICPKCEAQNTHMFLPRDLAGRSSQLIECPNCHQSFFSRIVKIKSKRSRGSKQNNSREFSVRIIEFSGAEDLIEFMNKGYDDFELRARDLAVFSFINNELRIVQNLTIHQYMKVSKPGCYLATYIYGADSQEVILLREFRDEVLMRSTFFKRFVDLYYCLSPKAIARFGNRPLFRLIVLVTLKPAIFVVSQYIGTDPQKLSVNKKITQST